MILNKPSSTKIDILGSSWIILVEKDNPEFEDCDGYIDYSTRTIHIECMQNNKELQEDLIAVEKKTVRHEIIHAFLYESGLDANSCECSDTGWAHNEEMIDWIALQFYKIQTVYKELKV